MSSGAQGIAQQMEIRPEVASALADGRPVVAMETSLVTHGFAYPVQIEVVTSMWNALVEDGVTPATIGVREGRIVVGLSLEETDELAQLPDVVKVTRANYSWALATALNGGTTVAATMMAAHAAGIEVFCTGGLGGVHRGAYSDVPYGRPTLDVSADLEELGRTRVVVVCGGVKSILDVPHTLEYLETKGVPVVTWGQRDFPGFWSSSSRLRSPLSTDDLSDVVDLIVRHREMNLESGVVVGVPVPKEHELPFEEAERAIEIAMSEAEGVKGGDVTPWLLARIKELTNGRSEITNKKELLNNARQAAKIAGALSLT